MRKTILKSVLATFLVLTSLVSCSSDPIGSDENYSNKSLQNTIVSKPPPPGLPEFYYIQNGAFQYTSISNSSANASTSRIYGKIGSLTAIEMRLASLAVGTYSIGGSNNFFYKKKFITGTWVGVTGKIIITYNEGRTISGTFNITSGSGISGVENVSGYFESVLINP